jgi:hypothetical protein
MTAMTPDLKTVTNHAGTPFRVRIVRVGECSHRPRRRVLRSRRLPDPRWRHVRAACAA